MVEGRKLLNGFKSLVCFFMLELERLDTAKEIIGKKLSDFFIKRRISKITMRKDHNVHDGRLIALKNIFEVIELYGGVYV
jgi:hypothetical protein